MASAVSTSIVTSGPVVMSRFRSWNGWRVPQVRSEYQDQRRNDPKCKKCVERRQNAAKVSTRIDR
jgi:hypothetical protein